ncbi:MAG: hypothetical protein DRJ35_05640 [Thermoprotei archaeon]|nr:MAG: hypothetical protein DRJ35_05640 [Thermoprotei archaeon]
MEVMGKLVAIKNIDRELYRRVKAIASLEERTIGSIINEALRLWLSLRMDKMYDHWLRIEEAYKENYKVLVEKYDDLCKKCKGKYLVICNGKILGIFNDCKEATLNAYNKCSRHAFVMKIGDSIKEEEIELGFPVSFP